MGREQWDRRRHCSFISHTSYIYIFLPLVSNYLSDSLTHEQNVEKFESYITCVQRLSVHRGDITAHRIN